MHAILKRLTKEFPLSSGTLLNEKTSLVSALTQLDATFWYYLATNHQLFHLEYQALRQQLVVNLSLSKDKNLIKEQLVAAMQVAILLRHLYENYLNVPREVDALNEQLKGYAEILTLLNEKVPDFAETTPTNWTGFSPLVRKNTILSNNVRLLIGRSKRLLDRLADNLPKALSYQQTMTTIGYYLDPVLSYLAWCFYVPRFFLHLTTIFKHTFLHAQMSPKEASLGVALRFKIQIQRHGLDLYGDFVAITVGLINCFVLVGVLAPIAGFVSATFFLLDIIVIGIHAGIKFSQFNALRTSYLQLPQEESSQEYLKQLDIRIDFEKRRLLVFIMNTVLVFIASALALFVSWPAVPLIGALLLLVTTFANLVSHHYLDNHQPNTQIQKIPSTASKLGFFKSPPELQPSSTTTNTTTLAPLSSLDFLVKCQ